MKKIIIIFLFTSLAPVYAITLDLCSNQDADSSEVISNEYIFCNERNFAKIQYALGISRAELPICRIFDSSVVDLSYIDCLNDNIHTISQYLQIRLTYCPHYNNEFLNDSFISCLNGRFGKIENALNQDLN